MKWFASVVVCALICRASIAATFLWDGATGLSDWNAKFETSPNVWINNWGQIGTSPALPVAADNVAFSEDVVVTGGGALFNVFNVTNTETLTFGFGVVSIYGSNIHNSGTLTFVGNGLQDNGFGYDDRYSIVNSASLTGGGEVLMVEEGESLVGGGGSLTNVDNTIRGEGLINVVNLINQATVRAEGGRLLINNVTMNNAGGLLEIAADGILSLTGSIVTSGVLAGATGGQLQNGTLENVTITGVLKESFGLTTLAGTIINNGTLTFVGNGVNDTGFTYDDRYSVSASSTLTGPGRLQLVELNESALVGGGVLSNTGGHTIEGSGFISVNINNQGGLIRINSGNTLNLTSTITGGEFNGSANGLLIGNNAFANLTTTGVINRGFGATTLSGTINNLGTLTFIGDGNSNGFVYDDNYYISNSATLTGGGNLVMVEETESRIGGAGVLTNANHEISGEGMIDVVNLINHGSIRGNSAAKPIHIASNLTGDGTLENVRLEGHHSPGDGIGTVVASGSYAVANSAVHKFEIAGLLPGIQHDMIASSGSVSLAGQLQLQVSLATFLPDAGDEFTLFTALNGVSGSFANSASLITVSGGTRIIWALAYNPQSVVLQAASVIALDGDYNGNGIVDAADFVIWRRAIATGNLAADGNHDGVINTQDYTVWRNRFGNSLGTGTTVSSIPEPNAILPFSVAILWLLGRGRRHHKSLPACKL